MGLTDNLLDAADASEHAAAEPALRCPCCGEVAVDIAGAQQLYQLDVKEGGGKSHKADIPKCPVSGLDLPAMVYSVEPCGCRVSAEWAGGFSRELLSRANGGVPKPVVDMTMAERGKKILHYRNKLTALYALQAAYNTPEMKAAVDYWIVVCADQLQRLVPSGHNAKPPAKPIDPKVADWASKNGFAVPAEPTPIQEGVPVYRMGDGTVSTVPNYPGQEPIGYTAAPSAPKVVFEPTPVGGEEKFQAALEAAKSGAVSGDTLLNIFGVNGNTTITKKEAYGEAKGVFANAAHPPAEPVMPPVLPTITNTRNGQWAVRYGDIYRVFLTRPEADDYATQLTEVTPGFAAKMKPKLQTLPVEPQPVQVPAPEPLPAVPPSPKIEKHAKKKRTIRKIQD